MGIRKFFAEADPYTLGRVSRWMIIVALVPWGILLLFNWQDSESKGSAREQATVIACLLAGALLLLGFQAGFQWLSREMELNPPRRSFFRRNPELFVFMWKWVFPMTLAFVAFVPVVLLLAIVFL